MTHHFNYIFIQAVHFELDISFDLIEKGNISLFGKKCIRLCFDFRAFMGSIDVTKGANLLIIVKSSIQTGQGKGVLTKNCKIYKLLLRN